MSSDDVCSVAVNGYETTEAKLKHHNFTKYTSATTARLFSATTARLFLLAYYRMVGCWRGIN